MKTINSSAEILYINEAPLELIEKAGRTCYKSEDRITPESAPRFVSMIKGRHHDSVLEHSMMSVRIVCSRGISHELVRHRLASFSQESTRYCNYTNGKFDGEITFIWPAWIKEEDRQVYIRAGEVVESAYQERISLFVTRCLQDEENYLADIKLGATPQEARGGLPNDAKTEVVITANFREWRHILSLRTSDAAHPDCREVIQKLLDAVKARVGVVFDDIGQPTTPRTSSEN